MPKPLAFCFAIHCHQPVGNFDEVIEATYQSSYWPFLQVLDRHPQIPFAVHYSGYLWLWIEKHHPECMDLLRRMVARDQVELLTGSFYECILPLVPDAHKVAQIKKLSDYLQQRFGQRPQGMWLAERVWEPNLPRFLADAGVGYVTLDDMHFFGCGFSEGDLRSYYSTHDNGPSVDIFPISEKLRYLIPFKPVSEVFDYFHSLPQDTPRLLTLADDGEKFGAWPGTYQWVYEQKWLHHFLEGLEKSPVIETLRFSAARQRFGSAGTVFLPTGSYMEMAEWSLPGQTARLYHRVGERLHQHGLYETARPFVRGGIFRNFLSKYSEAAWMHARMLDVAARVDSSALAAVQKSAATEAVFRSQANDAYWHGVFGGLYLPHLRHGVFQNLLEAEALLLKDSKPQFSRRCLTGHVQETAHFNSPQLYSVWDPAQGRCLELSHLPTRFCGSNVLTRREESYHDKVASASTARAGEGETIHGGVRAKEAGLAAHLVYDPSARQGAIDAWMPGEAWQDTLGGGGTVVELTSTGQVQWQSNGFKMERAVAGRFKKTVCWQNERTLKITLDIALPKGQTAWLGQGWHLSMLSDRSPDRYLWVSGADGKIQQLSPALTHVGEFAAAGMGNDWDKVSFGLRSAQRFRLKSFPIYTVSLSEDGLEKTYQGSALWLWWKVAEKIQLSYEVFVGGVGDMQPVV